MKYLLASVSVILALQVGTAFAADCANTVQTVEKGKLTIAAYDYPPFTSASSDGKISGIDPDIVMKAAKENCLDVVSLVMEPAATIQAVISGKADVAIGSWNRTEKRSQVLGISAPIYLDPMGIFSKEGWDTIDALQGKKVGTVTGYLWVPELQALFGGNLKLYPNATALAQDLEAGRLDAGIDAYNYGAYIQKSADGYKGIVIKLAQADERVQASVQAPQVGVLYTKGNDSLGNALDESIAKQQKDGSITKAIEDAGFDKKVGDVGEPWLVK
jgi:polar amino acid transport system substrate-binding protein